MPTVGDTKFPYTKAGMRKAKAWSEMIGKPIKMEKKKAKKKYQEGGFAQFSPGDATMTSREALIQQMMSPENLESMANLTMGSVGGGGSGGIFKMLKNMTKKPKAAKKLTQAEKAAKDWQKAKENMIKAGRKDAPATDKTYRPWLDPNIMAKTPKAQKAVYTKGKEALKEIPKAKGWHDKAAARAGKPGQTLGRDLDPKDIEKFRKALRKSEVFEPGATGPNHPEWGTPGIDFAKGGQIPQETLLRAMYALGGEIAAGRRMYGMGKKKKSLQTADVGPVRGMKKGGKVKYHV